MAITLDGTTGSTQPSVAMSGATSGTVTLTPPAVAGTQGYTLPSALPTASGQALTATTAGVMSWATASASPAGSTTQVQYNNAGAFAGSANLTFDGTSLTSGAFIPTSATVPTNGMYLIAASTLGFSAGSGEKGRFNVNGFFLAANNGSYPDGSSVNSHYFSSSLATTPALQVRADSATFSSQVIFVRGNRNTTNNSFKLFQANNGNDTGTFQILDSGNAVNTNNSYGSASDVKLKENISDATPKLNDLLKVKVRQYNLKIKPNEKQIGVIAQELEQVFPSLVEESIDRDPEGNDLGETTKSVKYSVFVPMLIKAIQELTARVAALEAK